ncbi:MAG: Antitoxin ParD [Verrucomicrobiota bacterium]|jgi:hypothetical protein
MKTTIEIPEQLYKQAKIRAIERGQTLKQIVLSSLERELNDTSPPAASLPPSSYWAKRTLLPDFAAAQQSGAYRPQPEHRDITDLISADRDGR